MKKFAVLLLIILLSGFEFYSIQLITANEEITENPWISHTPLPTSGYHFAAEAANNKLYLIKQTFNYEYDLVSWTAKASMPTCRYAVALATCENKIYCITGADSSDLSAANEVYDPVTVTWETKTPIPTPRINLNANVVNGKIYLISGAIRDPKFPDTNVYLHTNVTEVYDITTDTWTPKTSIPHAVSQYVSVVVNDKIYVIADTLTQIYDPQTDTWSYGKPLPYPVTNACGVAVGNRIYVIGGLIRGYETDYNQVYIPDTDSWLIGEPMPTARYGSAAAVLDNEIYVIGGLTGIFYAITPKDVNEQYDPLKDSAIPIESTTIPTITPQARQDTLFITLVVISAAGILILLSILLIFFHINKNMTKRGK